MADDKELPSEFKKAVALKRFCIDNFKDNQILREYRGHIETLKAGDWGLDNLVSARQRARSARTSARRSLKRKYRVCVASSQILCFLFKVRRARVINRISVNRRGFINRQRKRVMVGEEENRRSFYFSFSGALFARWYFRKELKEN